MTPVDGEKIEEGKEPKKALVNLYLHHKKLLVILRSEGYDTLSLYLDDFMIKYKPSDMLIKNRDECLKFLRETLPKITVMKDKQIGLMDKKSSFIENSI